MLTFLNKAGNIVEVCCAKGDKIYDRLIEEGLTDDPLLISKRFEELAALEKITLLDPTLTEGDQETLDLLLASAREWASKSAPEEKQPKADKPKAKKAK